MKKFLVLFLAAYAVSSASAGAAPLKKRRPKPRATPDSLMADENAPPAPPEVKWSYGATLDAQGQFFPVAESPEVKQAFGILSGEANGSVKVGQGFLAKVRPTAHWDPNNPTKSEQSWVDLPEFYVQLKKPLSESLTLTSQTGFNVVTWGVTDGYNPVDIVSARRYSDPLHSEKLGALSELLRLDFGFLLFEGIYIPTQRRAVLPGEKSRWLPRELPGPITYAGNTTTLPAVPRYSFGDDIRYDNALLNNFGARVSSHLLGMDAAAYFFDGAASLPAVKYTLDLNATVIDGTVSPPKVLQWAASPGIVLQRVYHRVTVTGASAVFPIWELIVRAELAVTKAYRKGSELITEQNTEAVTEVEHTFNSFLGENRPLTLIGIAAWADPHDNGLASTGVPSLTRLFDRAAGAGFRYQPSDPALAEGYAFFDTKHGGSLYDLTVSYKLNDTWKVYGGGEYFQGKSSQPVGAYRYNHRAIAGLKATL